MWRKYKGFRACRLFKYSHFSSPISVDGKNEIMFKFQNGFGAETSARLDLYISFLRPQNVKLVSHRSPLTKNKKIKQRETKQLPKNFKSMPYGLSSGNNSSSYSKVYFS